MLAAAIDATGATLLDCRTVHVQYRPESDLVVRYAATVRRPDGSVATETLTGIGIGGFVFAGSSTSATCPRRLRRRLPRPRR